MSGTVQSLSQIRRITAAVLLTLFIGLLLQGGFQSDLSAESVWTTTDIGAPAFRGFAQSVACSAGFGCPLFVIGAGGAGIAGTSDQFTFLQQTLTGDGVATIRVLALTGGASSAVSGVMFRESLKATSPHVTLLASRTGETLFSRRRAASGATTVTKRARPQGSIWLRLERTGQTITASTSADGSQWTVVGTEVLNLPDTVFVGVATASASAVIPLTATVSDVTSLGRSPTLPTGWASADLGPATPAGAASLSSDYYLALSWGAGVSGLADAFRFIYSRVTGDATLSTRVLGTQGAPGRQAGIIIRDSLNAGAVAAALVVGDKDIWFVRRTGTGLLAVATRVAPIVAPLWLKLERRGTQTTAYYSTNGVAWTSAGTFAVPLATETYAGLAMAGGGSGSSPSAGAFDSLSLNSVAANQKPSVSLTAPSAGRIYFKGDQVAMAASASDPDDRVTQVDFFANGAKIGSDSTSPYAASWPAGTLGLVTLTAVAYDDDGASTTSTPAIITVLPSIGSGAPSGGGSAGAPSGPWKLSFEPSVQDALVDRYVMEVSNAATRVVAMSRDLGKPAAAAGTCVVDIDSDLNALPHGEYLVLVRAIGPTGSSPSGSTYFSR